MLIITHLRVWENHNTRYHDYCQEAYIWGSSSLRFPSPSCNCPLFLALPLPSGQFPAKPLWCTVVLQPRIVAAAEVGSMDSPLSATQTKKTEGAAAPRETLTITDNRTGKSYEIPITHDTIRAADLRQIKVDPKEFGMMSYDPAFNNTASCISKITYIDGDAGILRHRGYPIEDLAE